MGVRKRLGGRLVVDGLSLCVPTGGIYGLIGPNGSGKTTTLRMALDIIRPDQGSIQVLGGAMALSDRDRISYLPEERGLYRKMTVRRLLRYYGRLKAVPTSRLEASLDAWIERLGLTAWSDKRVETLSKGQAQRVQFIAALVSDPDLLILDEPFSGLDPGSVKTMKAVIRDLRAQGRTIIFSTHQMAAAEELCDRIGMLCQGRLVLDGTLAQIQRAHSPERVRLRTDRSLAYLRALPGVLEAGQKDGYQTLRLQGPPQRFLGALLRRARVRHFEVCRASLDEIFLALAGKAGGDLVAP